jgi:hypothetical protein
VTAALRAVGRAVRSGLELRAGVSFYLGEGALLEGVGLSGLAFWPARSQPGLRPPPGALHAVAVTGAELELIGRTSVHRVLSRLGVVSAVFPWPVWSFPRRSVVRADEPTTMSASRRVALPGIVVSLDGIALTLRVPRAAAPGLASVLGALPRGGAVVLSDPDPVADGLLVWDADRQQTRAVSAPRAVGRYTAGAFVRICDGDVLSGGVVEDGFALTVDPASRDGLRAALIAGDDWRARAAAGEVRAVIV